MPTRNSWMLQIERAAIRVVSDPPALEPVQPSDQEDLNGLFELLVKIPDVRDLGASRGNQPTSTSNASSEASEFVVPLCLNGAR